MNKRRWMISGVLVLAITVSGIAFAAPDNGTPFRLTRIEALLEQVLSALTPQPPAPQTRTRLLLPFVSNWAGFDSGVSIANTGLDSTGTVGKAGTCTIHYFGRQANGDPPVRLSETTNRAVLPGETITFVLSTGGGLGIRGNPDFQGYVEVECDFPLAHGFGFLTDGPIGAARVASTTPALVLQGDRTLGLESAGQ